jgi:subtilase family serine protease
MHQYQINGATYMANATAAKIPMALAPVVAGLASLNNFPTKNRTRPAGRFSRDSTGHIVRVASSKTGGLSAPVSPFTLSEAGFYGLGPTDLATIYNIAPLWNAATPITGAGQTIAVIGNGDIHPTDFVQFRQMFGLPLGDTSGPTGTQYLNIVNAGPDAGFADVGDEIEADLDTEWASAVAPGAMIDYVTGASTASTGAMFISIEYVIDNNLAPVMNISQDVCELGFDFNGPGAFINTLYQQAAAQGITVVAPTGDSGSANCDDVVFENGAKYGLQVNAIASTPYNVAVGGTDFNLSGGIYFNSSNNATTGASALGYIPETVWNNSCADPKLGTTSPFTGETPEQVCNSGNTLATQNGLSAGGGGKSSCTASDGQTAASCSNLALPSQVGSPERVFRRMVCATFLT